MKKLFITISLVLFTIIMVMAHDDDQNQKRRMRDKSVYLEILAPHSLVGVSYDARFKGNRHLGYRVGLRYDYSKTEIFDFYDSKSHSIAVPLEVNSLIGKGNSRLELGLGTSLGYYHSRWHVQDEEDSAGKFGYFCFCNIGYRLTTKKGFQLRLGLSPTFNFGGEHAVGHDVKIYPYLSLGYAF